MKALYPTGSGIKPSSNWWKFGFLVFYITDRLQNVEAFVSLGYGRNPRLGKAIKLISDKGDAQGKWPMEYDYSHKIWFDTGSNKQPSKWITYRALKVLKSVEKLTLAKFGNQPSRCYFKIFLYLYSYPLLLKLYKKFS